MHRLGGLFNKNTSASSLTAVPGGASGGGSTSGGGGGSANKLNVNVQRKLSRGVDHNRKTCSFVDQASNPGGAQSRLLCAATRAWARRACSSGCRARTLWRTTSRRPRSTWPTLPGATKVGRLHVHVFVLLISDVALSRSLARSRSLVTDDVIKVEIWDVVDKGKPKPNQPSIVHSSVALFLTRS